MSEVVNIKWVTAGEADWPDYVEVTLANGRVVRYRPVGGGWHE